MLQCFLSYLFSTGWGFCAGLARCDTLESNLFWLKLHGNTWYKSTVDHCSWFTSVESVLSGDFPSFAYFLTCCRGLAQSLPLCVLFLEVCYGVQVLFVIFFCTFYGRTAFNYVNFLFFFSEEMLIFTRKLNKETSSENIQFCSSRYKFYSLIIFVLLLL